MKTLDMREARLYGEKEIDEITKPDLKFNAVHVCIKELFSSVLNTAMKTDLFLRSCKKNCVNG